MHAAVPCVTPMELLIERNLGISMIPCQNRAVQGILVSPRMVEDHSCLALQAALRLALNPAGEDAPSTSAFADYYPPVVPPRQEDDDKSPV